MLKSIKTFFDERILAPSEADSEDVSEHALQLATAALLFEMTRADFAGNPQEVDAVLRALQVAFDITPAESGELLRLAEQETAKSVSLYEFTYLVDRELGPEKKVHIVELLWQVAFADGKLHKYEEHLVRKIADLLHVPHRDFIRAKHSAAQILDQQP